MISIVCASNNRNILEEELKESLKKQTYKNYELIIVDTIEKKFESAAEALNYGANKAKGDYIIFSHHDIIMKKQNELENIIKKIESIDDFGIVGIAGIDKNANIIGNITNGIPEVPISNNRINKITEVETVDEVMFVIKKDIFDKYKIITENKTWHLYAVEYSLLMKDISKPVLVIPSDIYHKSAGASMNKEYYKELKRLCKFYRKKMTVINTTMGIWHTNKLILSLDILKVKILIKMINIREIMNKKT